MEIVSGSQYVGSNKRALVQHVGGYYYLFYNKFSGGSYYPYYRYATSFTGLSTAVDNRISTIAASGSGKQCVVYHTGTSCFGMTYSVSTNVRQFIQMSIASDGSLTVITDHQVASSSYNGFDLGLTFCVSPARWTFMKQVWSVGIGPSGSYFVRSSNGYPTQASD